MSGSKARERKHNAGKWGSEGIEWINEFIMTTGMDEWMSSLMKVMETFHIYTYAFIFVPGPISQFYASNVVYKSVHLKCIVFRYFQIPGSIGSLHQFYQETEIQVRNDAPYTSTTCSRMCFENILIHKCL